MVLVPLHQIHNAEMLKEFSKLDDSDIFLSIKVWMNDKDKVLSTLASNFVNRSLYKIKLQENEFDGGNVSELRDKFKKEMELNDDEIDYFVFTGTIANNAYNPRVDRINILLRDGSVVDVTEAADQLNVTALSEPVEKHFLCHPKLK